jgi:hypothetical protein
VYFYDFYVFGGYWYFDEIGGLLLLGVVVAN